MKYKSHFIETLLVALHRVIDTGLRTVFGVTVYKHQIKKVTLLVLAIYAAWTALLMWLSAGRPRIPILKPTDASLPETLDALSELSKSYSPIFFDLALIVTLGILSLVAYRHGFLYAVKKYKRDRLAEIKRRKEFNDQTIAFPEDTELRFEHADNSHFEFPPPLKCTIDSSALNSDAIFQSTQGGFDLAKLTLIDVKFEKPNIVQLKLGTTSFRDANLSHYWSFVPIASESTDETESRKKSIFDLTAKSQILFVTHLQNQTNQHSNDCTNSTPNTPKICISNMLGISAFVRLNCSDGTLWLMRERSGHVAADQRAYCASVAGTIDVYPDFAHHTSSQTNALHSKQLLAQEYEDEVEKLLSNSCKPYFNLDTVKITPLGLIFTIESNFQPELYYSIDASINCLTCEVDSNYLLTGVASKKGELHIIKDISSIFSKLRDRDKIAINTFFQPIKTSHN